MDKGEIQQIGDPRTIYELPANTFVANFIGVANLLEGTLVGRSGEFCMLDIPIGAGHAPLQIKAAGGDGAIVGQRLILSVRPEDLALHSHKPNDTSGGNVFEGEIIDTVYLGNALECRVRVGDHEVGVQMDHYEDLVPRQRVFLSFFPDHGLCLKT
jgi:ABC-type Fe3+/spermidine/putrescine transport system ATPase subunit